jgi:hypothetical protein
MNLTKLKAKEPQLSYLETFLLESFKSDPKLLGLLNFCLYRLNVGQINMITKARCYLRSDSIITGITDSKELRR